MEMSKEFKALVSHYNRVKSGWNPSERREFMAHIEREQRREIIEHQKKEKAAKATRSVGGGRAAAAIDSRRGGVAKSLMTRKLMPKT